MESNTYKISLTVGSKLLLCIGFLLITFILFLNISTIFILNNDKKAYTYQSQSNECILAGHEFINIVGHGVNYLKTALSVVDPRSPISPAQSVTFKTLIESQNDILSAKIEYVDLKTGATHPYVNAEKAQDLAAIGLQAETIVIPQEAMLRLLPSLMIKSYAFINLSQMGKPAILGILLADINLKDLSSGMPIAIGIASLKDFGTSLEGSQITISDPQGNVLFDMDPTVLYGQKEISKDPLLLAGVDSIVSSGVKEYLLENETYLGSYNKPGFDLLITTRIPWKKAARSTYVLIEKFIILGLLGMGAAILLAVIFSRTLTAPINKLYGATLEIAAGNFDVFIKNESGDEIGALTNSFNLMSQKISGLVEDKLKAMKLQNDMAMASIQDKMKNMQLEQEMSIASTVQQNLFPAASYVSKNIKIFGHYKSASACGGDWWGYFTVGRKMCMMMGDVTGHGLPSALITASARSCFSVMEKLATDDPDFIFSPAPMLLHANHVIRQASQGNINMTLFIGIIDFDLESMIYSSAGHNPPWLFKKTGEGYDLSSLLASGPRLGDLTVGAVFEEKNIEVKTGDMLFFYTDGLMEGTDEAGTQYGKKKVLKFVKSNLDSGPEKLIKDLMEDFLKYNGSKQLDDDVTLAAALLLDPNVSS